MTQEEYILLLFNDLGIDTRVGRNAYLSREFNRPIAYLDELTTQERSQLIGILKDHRQTQNEIERAGLDPGY
jgi:hypothetical protein